ncbi:hypothetical protein EG68_06471 [Paragonimus skrjabini miyazakii]|uniref:protein disulfide-isomerase n=1 Tax=Paragonimus skrjabini miyazakii TaxID=59628 RepID=A0A8S9YTK9_9TREM|nr:hypothetical protein EG68_06471 [Paragonimus skrjabini miyazakii]
MRSVHYMCHAQTCRMLFFLLFLPFVVCSDLPEFTSDDFNVRVKDKPNTLVMFYAPWCGHCKKLKPSFIAAGKRLAATTDNIALALVDCTTQEGVCTEFGVRGYPTIKLFKDGKHVHDFDGARDEEGIVTYMLKRSKPVLRELSDAKQLADMLGSSEARKQPVIVAYIESSKKEWLESFKELASELLMDANFAQTQVPSILEVVDGKSLVRLYRPKDMLSKLDKSSVDFDGEWTNEALKDWIFKNSYGLVGYRMPENEKFFSKNNLVVFYHNVSLDSHAKGVNYFRNRLIKLIQSTEDVLTELTFAYSYSDDYLHELNELGFPSMKDYPVVALFSRGKKYKLEKYTPESFVEFLKNFLTGSLVPHVKSEEIPTEQKSAVVKVVAHTFDSVVNDPSKDVFVIFHAPWCGHCKQLMPKFETAAEKLKDEPDILFAAVDATANDIPEPFAVHGYPTLYFVPKLHKEAPKQYEGGREVDDLINFVARESSQELRSYDRKGVEKKNEL